MSEPEMVMVGEHSSTTIARCLGNYLSYFRVTWGDDASKPHVWVDLWNHVEAWARMNGHPTVAGTFPVFLRRGFHDTHDGAVYDDGDVEIARVSESYARAIDDMRRALSINLNSDGTIVYLVGRGATRARAAGT